MEVGTQYVTENEGYLLLAIAIIGDAATDLERALLRAKKDSEDYISRGQIIELERFFLSDYGQILSFDHGQAIIEDCRKNAAAGRSARRNTIVK